MKIPRAKQYLKENEHPEQQPILHVSLAMEPGYYSTISCYSLVNSYIDIQKSTI